MNTDDCEDCDDKVHFGWPIAALGVGLIIGTMMGEHRGMTDCRIEAVKSGAAYYQSNTNTGLAVFTWKKGCE